MLGKLLCRIGLHRWKYVGSSLFGHPAYMCSRPYCRTCKQNMFTADIYWQREEILEGDKR
jgi:hypothetical protein